MIRRLSFLARKLTGVRERTPIRKILPIIRGSRVREDAMVAPLSRSCSPTCNDNGAFVGASSASPVGILKIATELGGGISLTYVTERVAVIQGLPSRDRSEAA